jgi:hypothetical protein
MLSDGLDFLKIGIYSIALIVLSKSSGTPIYLSIDYARAPYDALFLAILSSKI